MLVKTLMDARRAVRRARQANDAKTLGTAQGAVNAAKMALGEREPPWWDDGAPDLNRHMACNTIYADWYGKLVQPT